MSAPHSPKFVRVGVVDFNLQRFPTGTSSDSSELDLDELQKHAAEQAALFQLGDDADIPSIPRERVPEMTEP